ncbi:unnamed protein product [Gongylonema pulchrum]|uniref:Secreted protein n=1 Tax=Gongylonema pulchrum TaxID=637853 RepID=A0A183DEV0_9BILA|nr:unnamed protein product [Gongylonema pulchrum]
MMNFASVKVFFFAVEPWFDRIPRALSAAGTFWQGTCASVFERALEVFVLIAKRLFDALRNLVLCSTVVSLFHGEELLPCKNYIVLVARIKAWLDERKKLHPAG